MPIVLRPEMGNSGGQLRHDPERLMHDHGYDYPLRSDGKPLNLRPLSKTHEALAEHIKNLADESLSVMQSRHYSWGELDETLTGFIPLTAKEKNILDKDRRKPVQIIIPYTFATLETLLTYQVEAFLSSPPLFIYEGRGTTDMEVKAKLMEVLVQWQLHHTKAVLPLHTMFRDGLAYGIGAVGMNWETRTRPVMSREEMNFVSRFIKDKILRREIIETYQDQVVFEGNDLINIDPYYLLPDPNYGIQDVQKMEYIGWVQRDNVMNLLNAEEDDPEEFFNVMYIKERNAPVYSRFAETPSKRMGASAQSTHKSVWSFPVSLIHMYMKIIPREWGLGPEDYPRKWLFTLADEEVIVRARPLDLIHDQFPIVINAPDYDGYSVTPISRLELVGGLQKALNFYMNSHIANARKALHDMVVVDPGLINMDDVFKPGPGKIIRLKKAAWGKNIKDAVYQLGISDVTRGHVGDANVVMDMMQKVTAATDATMGIIRTGGERRTAMEYQQTVSNALSRLKRLSLVTSIMAMQDLGYLCASHTQQLMSTDIQFKVAGHWPDILKNSYGEGSSVWIGQEEMDILYDVIPKDGSTPIDPGTSANTWFQIFQAIGQDPVLRQSFDVPKIFHHLARLTGAKNLHEFVLKSGPEVAQIQDPEQALRQAEKGNAVPIDQAPAGLLQGPA